MSAISNEVHIRIVFDDDSGPGVAKAIAEQKALQREAKQTGNVYSNAFKSAAKDISPLGLALALSPSTIPLLAGISAGVLAVGASFGAAAIGAAGFGLIAKSVLSSASSDSDKLTTVQTTRAQKLSQLQISLGAATTSAQRKQIESQIATVKKAADLQTATIKAGWTASYSSVVDNVTKIKSIWKDMSRNIAGPALLPWLRDVKVGIGLLGPVLRPVADLFRAWGIDINKYLVSSKGSAEVWKLATAFGQFSQGQLKALGDFIVNFGKGVFNLGRDLAGSGVAFGSFGSHLEDWGNAFLKWSKSKSARDDVDGFVKYLRNNGGTLVSILSSMAKSMPGLFAGASTVGTLEFKAISSFLGVLAMMPPGWQKAIVELAGAMLILKKTGVLTVGIKMMSKDAAGGKIISALGGSSLILPVTLVVAALIGLNQIKDKSGGGTLLQPKSNDLGINGRWAKDIEHWLGVAGNKIDSFRKWDMGVMDDVRHHTANVFDGMRHETSSIWDRTWNNTISRLQRGVADDGKLMANFRHSTANQFDNARHDAARIWDDAWSTVTNRTSQGFHNVMNWIGRIPGSIRNIFNSASGWLVNQGKNIISGLLSGIKSVWNTVANFFKGIPHAILNFLGIHSPPQWAIDAGKHIMNGLHIGMKAGGGTLGNFSGKSVLGMLGGVGGAVGSGVGRWSGLVLQALKMLGLSPKLLHNVLFQMTTESGGNPRAINLTDSNAAAGDPSRGLMQTIGTTFAAYAGPFRGLGIYNPFANIYAALNYARHRYGPSLMSGGMGIGSGHGYAAGGPAGGWIMAGEHGRELIKVPGGSHVKSNADTEGLMSGGSRRLHMTIGLAQGYGDGKIMKEIMRQLRIAVYDDGGNVQDVLGWRT